jgi:hypothetical protein
MTAWYPGDWQTEMATTLFTLGSSVKAGTRCPGLRKLPAGGVPGRLRGCLLSREYPPKT